jgi:hypothetical protein
MTTGAQRTIVREYLTERFGPAFQVTVTAVAGLDDEAHVAFPIPTPAGKHTVGHHRYASTMTRFRFDGRKAVHPDQLNALYVDLYNRLHKGAHDARYTGQARDDYQAALDAAL